MSAGARDTFIAFDRSAPTQADNGEEIDAWAEIGAEWAAIFWGRGDERRQAAVEQGQQPATFQVLLNPFTDGIRIKDRLRLVDDPDALAWDIVGIAPRQSKGEIEFTAVRAP